MIGKTYWNSVIVKCHKHRQWNCKQSIFNQSSKEVYTAPSKINYNARFTTATPGCSPKGQLQEQNLLFLQYITNHWCIDLSAISSDKLNLQLQGSNCIRSCTDDEPSLGIQTAANYILQTKETLTEWNINNIKYTMYRLPTDTSNWHQEITKFGIRSCVCGCSAVKTPETVTSSNFQLV